ncbi:MAG: hypothetical protein K8U57_40555 [Planctomycetes bacterium]|nr:hypothetical protein [Planctomycetota bacterium]
MEHFQRDSWGSPFIFQREVLPNSVRLTITSPHLHYKTQRPISIEIDIPSDGG